MKNNEKNIKIIEAKTKKENNVAFNNKRHSISDEEKKVLMVFYSYLKNLS